MAHLQDYEITEVIGKGSYGSVKKARRKSDQFVCCIKEVQLGNLRQRELEEVINEVRAHPPNGPADPWWEPANPPTEWCSCT